MQSPLLHTGYTNIKNVNHNDIPTIEYIIPFKCQLQFHNIQPTNKSKTSSLETFF